MKTKSIKNRNGNFKDSTAQVRVMGKKWDFLIILDASRYDFFEKMFKHNEHLFKGKLYQYKSVASSTLEWRNKSFKGYHKDVIYVSSNPYISSTIGVEGFRGTDHFYKVIDVWNEGWNEEKKTVLPEIVTETAIKYIKNYPNKRFIIHYVQPHAPYINLDLKSKKVAMFRFRSELLKKPKSLNNSNEKNSNEKKGIRLKIIEKFLIYFNKLKKLINKPDWILGNQPKWRLREFFRLDPLSPMDAVRRMYGKEGLKKAYIDNLNAVLKSVLRLLNHLTGRVVITSDHGELLGEKGCYSHLVESNNPYLKIIPWLELQKYQRSKQLLKEDAIIKNIKIRDFTLKI